MSNQKKSIFHRYSGAAILLGLLLAVFLLGLRLGSAQLTAREFWRGLTGQDPTARLILWELRLPRLLGGLLAGAGLALSGTLLQQVTGNALAGPNIIGVNAGAGFAAILTLWLLPKQAAFLPFFAFLGAVGALLLILSLAQKVRGSKASVILAGIAVSALLNAAISFISYADPDLLASYNYFSVGGLSGVQNQDLLFPALLILAAFLFALLFAKQIDLLCLGDALAASLGARIKATRILCLLLAGASAAAAVSFAGLLGFIGLIVPHIARRMAGSNLRLRLMESALLGGILLIAADLLGRLIIAPSELPVGIITALLGAPFFLYLLCRKEHRYDL